MKFLKFLGICTLIVIGVINVFRLYNYIEFNRFLLSNSKEINTTLYMSAYGASQEKELLSIKSKNNELQLNFTSLSLYEKNYLCFNYDENMVYNVNEDAFDTKCAIPDDGDTIIDINNYISHKIFGVNKIHIYLNAKQVVQDLNLGEIEGIEQIKTLKCTVIRKKFKIKEIRIDILPIQNLVSQNNPDSIKLKSCYIKCKVESYNDPKSVYLITYNKDNFCDVEYSELMYYFNHALGASQEPLKKQEWFFIDSDVKTTFFKNTTERFEIRGYFESPKGKEYLSYYRLTYVGNINYNKVGTYNIQVLFKHYGITFSYSCQIHIIENEETK